MRRHPPRTLTTTVAVVGLLGVVHTRAAETPVLALTLEQAVERALARNETLVIEREALVSADAAVLGSRGAYDPLVELEAAWMRSTLPVNSSFSGAPAGSFAPTEEGADVAAGVRQLLPTGGEVLLRAGAARTTTDGTFDLLSPVYDSQLGVEIRQPLLRGRRIDAQRRTLRVAAADRERAQASLSATVKETVAEVEAAYWALVAAREEVGVREDTVRWADQQLEETLLRIDSGVAPEAEAAQPRAELERRRGELLAGREAVARAENALRLLILGDGDGDEWGWPVSPLEDAALAHEPVDVPAELERALATRAEIDLVRALAERRAVESDFARDTLRPALDAVAAYDRFGFAGRANPAAEPLPGLPASVPPELEGELGRSLDVLGEGDFDAARVGVVLSVPIGNRAARGALAIAESAERQVAAELARVKKEIRAEVLDAAAAVDTAHQRIEAARSEREAAQVQLASERERFDVGLSTNFLVLTRQNDLERARLGEIAARTDYRRARSELLRTTGALLDERGITLE